jgi:hypothetical protein
MRFLWAFRYNPLRPTRAFRASLTLKPMHKPLDRAYNQTVAILPKINMKTG